MAWGFRSRTATGQVQIDSEYLNLSLKRKFTVNSITATQFYTMAGFETSAEGNLIYYVVDYPEISSVVAVRNNSGRAIGYNELINEASTRNPPPAGYKRAIFYQEGTTPDTLTVYQYGDIQLADVSGLAGWGMRIKAGGRIVYHSGLPVLKTRNFVNLQQSTVGTTITTPPGQTSAFLFANVTTGLYRPSGGLQRTRIPGLSQTSPTTIAVVGMLNYDRFTANQPYATAPCPALIVDVTGL